MVKNMINMKTEHCSFMDLGQLDFGCDLKPKLNQNSGTITTLVSVSLDTLQWTKCYSKQVWRVEVKLPEKKPCCVDKKVHLTPRKRGINLLRTMIYIDTDII